MPLDSHDRLPEAKISFVTFHIWPHPPPWPNIVPSLWCREKNAKTNAWIWICFFLIAVCFSNEANRKKSLRYGRKTDFACFKLMSKHHGLLCADVRRPKRRRFFGMKVLDLFLRVVFYRLYHGTSPFYTTIWDSMFATIARHFHGKSK